MRRFAAVVDLLGDAFRDLGGDGSDVGQRRAERAGRTCGETEHGCQQLAVRQIVANGLGHTGILNLHRDIAAVVKHRPMDLADGRRRHRLVGKRPEYRADARRIAVVGVNALLGRQATRVVFHAPQVETPDDEYISDWTAMLAGRIEAAR